MQLSTIQESAGANRWVCFRIVLRNYQLSRCEYCTWEVWFAQCMFQGASCIALYSQCMWLMREDLLYSQCMWLMREELRRLFYAVCEVCSCFNLILSTNYDVFSWLIMYYIRLNESLVCHHGNFLLTPLWTRNIVKYLKPKVLLIVRRLRS